jgi:hypothetical protein
MMRKRSSDPEIWCDFNGRMTERGYLPTNGTIQDLAALGLTLEEAVGHRFVFVSDDADEQGNPDDIMHNGVVVRDARCGVLLEIDDTDYFYHRSELSDQFAVFRGETPQVALEWWERDG